MTGKEDLIIINTELLTVLGAKCEDYNNEIEKLNKNENYQLAINQDGVIIYRKKSFTLSE